MTQEAQPLQVLKYTRFPLEMLDLEWATSSDVVVYSFMLNRYSFFKGIGNEYFENIEDIAKGSRQAIATVKRAVKKLQKHDFISVRKIRVQVGCSNSYHVHDIFGVLDVKQTKQSTTQENTQVKRSVKFYEDDDETDGPF